MSNIEAVRLNDNGESILFITNKIRAISWKLNGIENGGSMFVYYANEEWIEFVYADDLMEFMKADKKYIEKMFTL